MVEWLTLATIPWHRSWVQSPIVPKKGYSWALSAMNPNYIIKGQVLCIAVYGNGQGENPLRPLEKSREQSWSQASVCDFFGKKVMANVVPLRLLDC